MKKIVFFLIFIIAIHSISYLFNSFAEHWNEYKDEKRIEILRDDNENADPEDYAMELNSINEDIVGWISIPGTAINYPIVQANDNKYYLNHTFSKQQSSNGAIFIDYKNTKDFTDTVTSIYGHNVNNEYMLGSISKYKNLIFLQTHQAITIEVGESIYNYQVNEFYQVNMNEVSNIINENIDPNKNKIMLITCSYENGKGLDADLRYMLVATKI